MVGPGEKLATKQPHPQKKEAMKREERTGKKERTKKNRDTPSGTRTLYLLAMRLCALQN